MEGLRELYVVISDPSPGGIWESRWIALEERLLGPVSGVVRPRGEVRLPFEGCGTGWDLGNCKVLLTTPGQLIDG